MDTNQSTPQKGNGLSVAGLVIGIIAVICSFVPCLIGAGIFFGIMAIVFSAIGYSQANKSNQSKGMPLAGLIISSAAVIIAFIWIAFFLSFSDDIKHKFRHFDWSEFESFEEFEEVFENDQDTEQTFEDLEKALDNMQEEHPEIEAASDTTDNAK